MHEYSKIYKYRLLSLYNITCMYVFKVDHLVLDNHFVYPSLGKTFSHSQNSLDAYSSLW